MGCGGPLGKASLTIAATALVVVSVAGLSFKGDLPQTQDLTRIL